MNLLGRHQWKSSLKVKAHLMAENTSCARARAILLVNATRVDVAHEVFILAGGHGQWVHGKLKKYKSMKCSRVVLFYL
jgi:hypothetical protein